VDLSRGDVVDVLVSDPSGRPIDHPHPVVILEDSDPTSPDRSVMAVVVSTKFSIPLPWYWIRLPFASRPARSRTGLDAPCVAKCDWLKEIDPMAVLRKRGAVPNAVLAQLAAVLARMNEEGTP